MQTYLFYDIETTGLNKAFDQVLHFAGIRTDLAFNELERYEVKVKLNLDLIPSPHAMITHRMKLQEIQQGENEYHAMQKIHSYLNTPGTISLGYNTLGFDDEFLRFSFYRNLLPPYTHQFANQCMRMDIYPLTVMYFLFKKELLNWPQCEDKISLKLENLNAANQWTTGQAHNAMVDVLATVALAKQLASETEMWRYTCDYFDKKIDAQRLQQLGAEEALMVSGKFGADKLFQSIVLSLGPHNHYKNQLLWLRLDDKDFCHATAETILETTFVLSKKLGEPGFILPLKDRFAQYLSAERKALAQKNKDFLMTNRELFNYLSHHHRNYTYPVIAEADVETKLYSNGFWHEEDLFFCKKFHAANSTEKSQFIAGKKNSALYPLALRILGRHFPEHLTDEQQQEFNIFLRKTQTGNLLDFKGGIRLTPTVAKEQITELKNRHFNDPELSLLLHELENYLDEAACSDYVMA